MCRIDDCEMVELLQSASRRARKAHKCGECFRTIQIGETYHYEFGILEGYANTFRTCLHCMVPRKWLQENCGGFVYEQVGEEIAEHAQEYPALASPLKAIAEAMRAKWAFPGGPMPFPEMPPPIDASEHA